MSFSTPGSSSTAASTSPAEPPPPGRLAILTAYVMAANAVPLPFLPDILATRVRGAVAHDTVSRHGLSLTPEARAVFAGTEASGRAMVRLAGEALARQVLKRLGPLAAVSVLSNGLEAYALGLLLDRYIERVRTSASVRIDADEARRVRDAIDRAVLRALSPTLQPTSTTLRRGAEDLRGEITRLVDSVLLTSAALPSYVDRRLQAAFDEVATENPGLRDG